MISHKIQKYMINTRSKPKGALVCYTRMKSSEVRVKGYREAGQANRGHSLRPCPES